MSSAVKDVIRYMRERTFDMDNDAYASFLDELKGEIESMQYIAEWTEQED
jgi:hypothetical protein